MKPERHGDDIKDMYIISESVHQKSRKIVLDYIFIAGAAFYPRPHIF